MRPKSTLVLLLLFVSNSLLAQKTGLNESLELNAGISTHGSGDLRGFMFNTEYRKYLRERIYFAAGLGASWHDGSFEMKYTNLAGESIDASVRDVTAGYQLSAKLGYDFLQNNEHSLGLMLGPLVRYQTSSQASRGMYIYYPTTGTGLPYPSVSFDHRSPQRTTTLGGILQVSYRYQFNSRMFIGGTAGFQTDTNGDAITQGCMLFGVKI